MHARTDADFTELKGRLVALTGGTGFLGVHIARALHDAGARLALLARRRSPRERLAFADVRWTEGDVANEESLHKLARGADALIHVAGIVSAGSLAQYRETNVAGTRKAVQAALAEGVRSFILVSSLAAAGPATPGLPARREEDAPAPHTNYGKSKAEAEEALEREGEGLDKWSILRPGAIYGPYDRGFLIYYRLIGRGLKPVIGDGQRIFQPVFGPDVAAACVLALKSHKANRRSYFTVPRTAVTWEQFGAALERVMERHAWFLRVPEFILWPRALEAFPPTRALADRLNLYLAKRWEADPARAADELGWTAQTPLEEGLKLTYDWYRKENWL